MHCGPWSDPAEALRLAIDAGELGDNPDSEAALRSATRASHLVAVLSHEHGTTDADFASTQVVTVGNDSRIRFWSATSGRSSQGTGVTVSAVPGGLRGITVSPNGKRAAVWGDFNKVVVWDLITQRELHRFDSRDGTCPRGLTPMGADVIAVHGASVTRRRTEDGSALRRISSTVLRDATISADGTLLAAGSDDGQRVEMYMLKPAHRLKF